MRKSAIIAAFLFSIGIITAQENSDYVQKGDVLVLGVVSASGYQHIDFPRKNIIIKRGALANFNDLEGKKVIVQEVRSKNAVSEVVLKRKDGRNFFRFWPVVTANIEKALAKEELIFQKSKRKDSRAGS